MSVKKQVIPVVGIFAVANSNNQVILEVTNDNTPDLWYLWQYDYPWTVMFLRHIIEKADSQYAYRVFIRKNGSNCFEATAQFDDPTNTPENWQSLLSITYMPDVLTPGVFIIQRQEDTFDPNWKLKSSIGIDTWLTDWLKDKIYRRLAQANIDGTGETKRTAMTTVIRILFFPKENWSEL